MLLMQSAPGGCLPSSNQSCRGSQHHGRSEIRRVDAVKPRAHDKAGVQDRLVQNVHVSLDIWRRCSSVETVKELSNQCLWLLCGVPHHAGSHVVPEFRKVRARAVVRSFLENTFHSMLCKKPDIRTNRVPVWIRREVGAKVDLIVPDVNALCDS